VKEFLSDQGIPYTERNVAEDDKAMEELTALGFFTTPVVQLDGEVVVGFDRARLTALLT
jgi:glutaredoxin